MLSLDITFIVIIDDTVEPSTPYQYYVVGFDDQYMFSKASAALDTRSGMSRDANTADGPTTPGRLHALSTTHDWVEIRWEPAMAQEGIKHYEIWRDDTLIYTTVPPPDNNLTATIEDRRYAITHSYLDCNYTRAYQRCLLQGPDTGMSHTYRVRAIDYADQTSGFSNSLTVHMDKPVGQVLYPDLDDFTLVFDEQFDGNALNHSHWNTRLPWGPDIIINSEKQYYVDSQTDVGSPESVSGISHNPFEVSDGTSFRGRNLRLRWSSVPHYV